MKRNQSCWGWLGIFTAVVYLNFSGNSSWVHCLQMDWLTGETPRDTSVTDPSSYRTLELFIPEREVRPKQDCYHVTSHFGIREYYEFLHVLIKRMSGLIESVTIVDRFWKRTQFHRPQNMY